MPAWNMTQSDIQVTGKTVDRKDERMAFFHKRFIMLPLIPAAQVNDT